MGRRKRGVPFQLAALVGASLACNLSLAGPIADGGLVQPTETFTPAATNTRPADTATPTLEPSATFTATITPTPTQAVPIAQLSENTNCRTGPLSVYDLIATYLSGKSLTILGRNADQSYWYVSDPQQPGKECWLWGRYAQVSGPIDTVPVFTPPPTPTPSFVWASSWSVLVNQTAGTMNLTQNGSSVSGSLVSGGESYTISAGTSDGGRQASGDVLQNGNQVVKFQWYMLENTDQFRGSYVLGQSTYPWCGYRNGAGNPSPCLWP